MYRYKVTYFQRPLLLVIIVGETTTFMNLSYMRKFKSLKPHLCVNMVNCPNYFISTFS